MPDDGVTRPIVRYFVVELPVWRRGQLFRLAVLHPDTGRELACSVEQATMERVRIPYLGAHEPVVEVEWVE